MPTQPNRKSLHAMAVAVVLVLFTSFPLFAGGIGIELLFYTLDLSVSLGKVPAAVGDSLHELGIPSADAAAARADLETELAKIEAKLPVDSLPVPLLGGSIEFPIIIGGLRLSGGILTDTILRDAAGMFNFSVPQPLFDTSFPIDGHSGSITIDPHFSTFMVSAEVVSQIDLLIAGIEFGAGVSYVQGSITPRVDIINVPDRFTDRIAAALGKLHLDGFHWSALTTHFSLGVEIGPPFLRLFARGRFIVPLDQTSGWWDIRIGRFAGSLGVVIRF